MMRLRQGRLAGWATIAGLAMVLVSYGNVDPDRNDKWLWLSVLVTGIVCTLLGGITWSRTPGKRGLKTAFLGLVGCPLGAGLGGFLGYELANAGPVLRLEREIWWLLIGSWLGAILFAAGGVWWGIATTRRLRQHAQVSGSAGGPGDA